MTGRAKVLAAGTCLLAATAMCSCGGPLEAVGTGGTGAPSKSVVVIRGPITGLGSVVVNGQRVDESRARLTLNGEPDRAVSDLALGMVVEVRAIAPDDGGPPAAETIEASAIATGTVESIDTAGSLRVAGQAVRASASTALQGVSAVGGLRSGDAVRVYGLRHPESGAIEATRIEVAGASVSTARIVGVVGGLSGTRFTLEGQLVDAASAALVNLPGGLANGQLVEVQGPAPAAGATLVATRVEARAALTLVEGARVAVEDFVADFAGAPRFSMLGLAVEAAGAVVSGGALANGARVEVAGVAREGRIIADRVEVRSYGAQPPAEIPVSVEGIVSDFLTRTSFRIREQVIDASNASVTGGGAADLGEGRLARATGVVRGAVLVASTVELLLNAGPEGTPLTVTGTMTDFASPASFRVNGQAVSTSAATQFVDGSVSGLANGRRLAVDGRIAAGVLAASRVAFLLDPPPAGAPQPVELSGFITDFASPGDFRVNNQRVVTTAQTRYEDGGPADLAKGREVAIRGNLQDGIVTASQIDFGATGEDAEPEVEGSITSFASVASFVVSGQTIDASAARFVNGAPDRLAVGRKVHVKGPVEGGVLRANTLAMEL